MDQFLTNKEYEKLAIKILLSNNEPKTDESIGFVKSYLMMADNKYNPDIGNIDGFRWLYGRYAIKTLRKFYNKEKVLFTDNDELLISNHHYTPDLDKQENFNNLLNDMKKQLKSNEYRVIIGRRLRGLSLKVLGKQLSLSQERIRQIENKALEKMRRYYGTNTKNNFDI